MMQLEFIGLDEVHHEYRKKAIITVGKLIGQKPALKMKEVWSIRARLYGTNVARKLALRRAE